MNHYSKHIGDWRVATGKLTRVQRDIYAELIDTYYDQEAPLVGDFLQLCEDQACRTDEEREALSYILKRYFRLDGGVYRHDRCDDEIAAFHHKVEKASAAGRQSASVRAQRKMGAVGQLPPAPAPAKRTSNGRSTKRQLPSTHNPSSSPNGEQSLVGADAPNGKKRSPRMPPADFAPTPEMVAWAMGDVTNAVEWKEVVDSQGQPANLTLREVSAQTAAFKDFQFRDVKSDWQATWRNWIRGYATKGRPQGRGGVGALHSPRDAERRNTIETLTGRKNHGTGRQGLVIDGESRVVGEGEGEPPEPTR